MPKVFGTHFLALETPNWALGPQKVDFVSIREGIGGCMGRQTTLIANLFLWAGISTVAMTQSGVWHQLHVKGHAQYDGGCIAELL